MKVLSIIASLIVMAIPTISLIQSLHEFRKMTKGELVSRKACVTYIATSVGTWAFVMVVLWLAGVFKNFF